MLFNLNIKNIGKLADANIRIGQFTVLAGPNNTGKSFVSKLLYSLFDAMNANHAEAHIKKLTRPVKFVLNYLMRLDQSNNDSLHFILTEMEKLENDIKNFTIENMVELDKIIPDFVERIRSIRRSLHEIRLPLAMIEGNGGSNRDRSPHVIARKYLRELRKSLSDFNRVLSGTDAHDFITTGIELKIRENLVKNFQVAGLSELRGKNDDLSEVDIEGFGRFKFGNGEIEFEINSVGLLKLQEYSQVIYLESPVYWKLKNALENLRIAPRYSSALRERISGVPGYFYDLVSALKYEYTGDIAFPEVYERLTGKDVLGGKIALSESGDLSFLENGRNFSLPVTALGVANLGVLALLIERKVLDENSFLFIDEPEAHLHPAWQVVMAETLFELAKGGVNVVITTHSADILKWLEVHVKKNPDDEGLIALNKFPISNDEIGEQDFRYKMAAIKQELTRPFADLHMRGL